MWVFGVTGVSKRMCKATPVLLNTECKQLLRHTAMSLPKHVVTKAVSQMLAHGHLVHGIQAFMVHWRQSVAFTSYQILHAVPTALALDQRGTFFVTSNVFDETALLTDCA